MNPCIEPSQEKAATVRKGQVAENAQGVDQTPGNHETGDRHAGYNHPKPRTRYAAAQRHRRSLGSTHDACSAIHTGHRTATLCRGARSIRRGGGKRRGHGYGRPVDGTSWRCCTWSRRVTRQALQRSTNTAISAEGLAASATPRAGTGSTLPRMLNKHMPRKPLRCIAALRISQCRLRRFSTCQILQADFALGQGMDLQCLFQTHPARSTQPVIDLAGTYGRSKALTERSHGEAMLLEIGS